MSNIRFQALQEVQKRGIPKLDNDPEKNSEIFGQYVFNKKRMQKYLPGKAFQSVMDAIHEGAKIDHHTADQVAAGMKNWAIDHGATHYTHWFQPLTGLTAEKHDAFFHISEEDTFEKFTGKALIQQEPDASSFPSGGLRNTFEARGYTAWDPSSPAFLIKTPSGLTLCIPTVFISYTGEALDYKAPLLKACHSLENEALKICQYFDKNASSAYSTLGMEQEYFLVDSALYNARPDLVMSNRTLFGVPPAKGQQMDDHYFGSISERVHAFMVDLEMESMKLGIPLKTRHNEVAPSQFECAPLFEEVNLAVDHNQLMMDIIDKIAKRHHFRAILHEKPFAEINGSGKHCNWSIASDSGGNLLSPGKTSTENLQFLTFFVNVIKAVHEHAALLRASIANAGNDHRLGANEAPPAIISIFIGSQLTKVLEELEHNDKLVQEGDLASELKVDIPKIPELLLDNTDRNRTSPFAFTGNKFELRACGSSTNTASPMIALNAMVAHQLMEFRQEVDGMINNGEEQDVAIVKMLKSYLKDSKNVLFEGNNYSEEWVKEAEKRGLPNIKSTPEALGAYISDKTKKLFKDTKVLSERELEARYEILMDHYTKRIQIESRILGELALSHVIPPAVESQNDLLDYYNTLQESGIEEGLEELKISIEKNANHIKEVKSNVYEMIQERKKANNLESTKAIGDAYCNNVKPYFDVIRYHVDKLELNTNDESWQLPKYRELLFIR